MEGFIQIRRGLRDHIRQGKFSPNALAVYLWLHLCADFRTGMQQNSPHHICFGMGQTISPRQASRALVFLEKAGYIKRFLTKGKRGDYPIGIDKYEVSCGTEDGTEKLRLNIARTTDWQNPVYDSGKDDGNDSGSSRGSSSGNAFGNGSGHFVKKSGKTSVKKSGNNSFKKSGVGETPPRGRPPNPPRIYQIQRDTWIT